MLARRLAPMLLVALALPVAGASAADPPLGSPDPAFNGGSAQAIAPQGLTRVDLNDLLVDGTGRIVVGGNGSDANHGVGVIARLRQDGTFDPSFGTGGTLTADYNETAGNRTTYLRGLLRDPDGRLGAGGQRAGMSLFSARYATNGTLDEGYAGDGTAEGSFRETEEALTKAINGPDGATTLIGSARQSGTGATFIKQYLLRYAPDGTLDTTFGPSGVSREGRDYGQELAGGAVLPDRRVLSFGTAERGFYLNRTPATFGYDPTFNVRSITQVGAGNSPASAATGIAVASDGSIFLVGTATASDGGTTLAVAKYTSEGALDTTFGAPNGFVRIPNALYGNNGFGNPITTTTQGRIVIQGDGKLLLAGLAGSSDDPLLALVRLLPDGRLDPALGGDGAVTSAITGGRGAEAGVGAIALTKNGQLLVAGSTQVDGDLVPPAPVTGFVQRYIVRPASDYKVPLLKREPELQGVPSPGQRLTCAPAQWANDPTSIDVVWERAPRQTLSAEDPAWTAVAGTTGTTYAVTDGDVGSRLRCREVATNGDGSDSAVSASKRVDRGVPRDVMPPLVVGTRIVGQELECSPGTWENGPDFTYQWVRDGEPIAGASNRRREVVTADRNHRLGCVVGAANDIGAGGSVSSATVLAVGEAPRNLQRPAVTRKAAGERATDMLLTCDPGAWFEDDHEYSYQWLSEGTPVAGANAREYATKLDDLGRLLTCQVVSTNPVGPSAPATSDAELVPLPTGTRGSVIQAGGREVLDPLNLIALSSDYLDAIGPYVKERLQASVDFARTACRTRPQPPAFASVLGQRLSVDDSCEVVVNRPASEVHVTVNGAFWHGGDCADERDDSVVGGALSRRYTRAGRPILSHAPRFAAATRASVPLCPQIAAKVGALDPTKPPVFAPEVQARLAATQPRNVLWDVDNDGHVDADCDSAAPVLRSLYNRGIYNVHAVIVNQDSMETGQFSVADYALSFKAQSASQKGALRAAQPFACRTALAPPPNVTLPCSNEGWIGRVHVEGNICPIAARQVPTEEYDGLPPDVQLMLQKQALAADIKARAAPVEREAFGDVEASLPRATGDALAGVQASTAGVAATQIGALTGATQPVLQPIAPSWEAALKAQGSSFKFDKRQFALDQINVINGYAKVNGMEVRTKALGKLIMVPSDVGAAVGDVKSMTLAARSAETTLGGVPVGDPGALRADLEDRVKAEAGKAAVAAGKDVLKQVDFDKLAASLKSKLNLGPFKLAGDAKVRVADDGSAFIDAYAELNQLSVGPGGKPIRAAVQVHADRSGKLSLTGVHITAPRAYLGALKLQGIQIDWDGNGLVITGAVLIPPNDAGVRINTFRLDRNGAFRELDVDYLAGAGTGIPVGPGLFLTKLGGGLSLNPDELRARATIAVGPSVVPGGCPTVGLDADFSVHFGPGPFVLRANGQVQVLCIPLAGASFYADATGLVDLHAGVNVDLGLIYFNASVGGTIKLPDWQIDATGDGGIRGIISATVRAVLSNRGVAACGRITLIPNPFGDDLTLAAGAGVKFSNGRPPLSFRELADNISLFTGCDLKPWASFRIGGIRAAGTGGVRSFDVGPDAKLVPLQLIGSGGAPLVRVTDPKGKVYDLTGATDQLTAVEDATVVADAARSRTFAFLPPRAGRWTITPDPDGPELVDTLTTSVVPPARVSGKVGGAGAARTLSYDVTPIPGQVVRFVEHSPQGSRSIVKVKRGGTGTKAFMTSEGSGTRRTVVAEVTQDGVPRESVTVARFRAPSPRAGRPAGVRIARRGAAAVVTWQAAPYAKRYEVAVETAGGGRSVLVPTGGARRVVVRGLAREEGVTATVVAFTASGRRGGRATARVRDGRPTRAERRRQQAAEDKRVREQVAARAGGRRPAARHPRRRGSQGAAA